MSAHEQITARITKVLRVIAADTRLPVEVQDTAAEAADDVVGALRLGGRVALLLADTEVALKAAQDDVRAVLLAVMTEEGAPSIQLPYHTMIAVEGRVDAVVTDTALIPDDLMRQPPAAPDKAAILSRLRSGQPVPGATLRNGAPHLQIRARKGKSP